MRFKGEYGIEVIVTGDEILFGRIVDTNTSWIARRALEKGACLKRVTCIGDDIEEISVVVKDALTRDNDMVILTGGLGPSKDDLTVEAVGKAVNRCITLDPGALKKIRRIYAKRGIQTTARVEKMARILFGSKPILNPLGMATGMMLQEAGKTIVTLPGVPAEMKVMFDEYIAPLIEKRSSLKFLAKTFYVQIVWKDFFPMYRHMIRDYPDVFIKNEATPPEVPEERLKIKEIKVDIVVKGETKQDSESRLAIVLQDFKERIEALNGRLKTK